ncbi:NUDIX hydrolase [Microvirga flavescens]|uniref:NUDIX hydrolase n=1 Tax=Microvirga flavescens TaxID=2249811 RepID=UPI00130030BB|nr:NUDIX hydrolase [Microvirga flavescens]
MTSTSALFDPATFRAQLQSTLDGYAQAFRIDAEVHSLLRRQLAQGDDLHSRKTYPGHVTTSAIILNETGTKTLLIHHRSLNRWLQPGGHYEVPETLSASALREALEETGLKGLRVDPWHAASQLPVDVDSHVIPARPAKGEPEHVHHDFRYIVRADEASAMRPDFAEVQGAAWHDLSALEAIAPQTLLNLVRLRTS